MKKITFKDFKSLINVNDKMAIINGNNDEFITYYQYCRFSEKNYDIINCIHNASVIYAEIDAKNADTLNVYIDL